MERYSVYLPKKTFQVRFGSPNLLKFEIQHISVTPIDSNLQARTFQPHRTIMGRKSDLTIITNQSEDPTRKLKQLVNLQGESLNHVLSLSTSSDLDSYPLPGERSIVVKCTKNNSNGYYSNGNIPDFLSQDNLLELKKDFTSSESSLLLHLKHEGVYATNGTAITVYYFHDTDLTTVEDVISKCRTYKIIMKYPLGVNRAVIS